MVVGCLPYVAFCERKRDGRSEVGLVVWGRGSGVRIQGHSRNLFGHEKHKKSQKLTTHLRGGDDTQCFFLPVLARGYGLTRQDITSTGGQARINWMGDSRYREDRS